MSSEIEKLDRLDLRLLRELDFDSRQSHAALSRKLEVPQETVRYRLNSLVERKVIDRFITLIDAGRLGDTYYKILLKLYNVNEVQVLTIIRQLAGFEAVNWIARTDGIFDIAFTIRVRKLLELSEFVDRLKLEYRQFIHRITFAVNIRAEFAVRDYFVSKKRLATGVGYTTPERNHEPDELDIRILRLLGNDTRISASSIGERVGLSSEAASQRIRKLERNQIITRYTLLPALARLGIENYYVLLYFSAASQQRIDAFTAYCRQEIRIVYFIKALGEWDYELNLEVHSPGEYREIMMSLTKDFSDIIRDYVSLPVTGLFKFTIVP